MRKATEVLENIEPGMEMELDEGDIVLDVLIISRIQRLDRSAKHETILITTADHTGHVVSAGMVQCAREILATGWQRSEEDD